jgi:hypothetical protein
VAIEAPLHCLFCGVGLTEGTRTREDVFPRWLQKHCGIAHSELELANGTTVRYSDLLVPACARCNGVHASRLEQKVAEGTASPQDMWLWMLKILLGIWYWESGKPLSRDQRSEDHHKPISQLEMINLDYFQKLFAALKNNATFDPSPSGTLLSFRNQRGGFDYVDRVFCHPQAQDRVFCAGLVAFDNRVWIALFDDGRRVGDLLDLTAMKKKVAAGTDPRAFFPELMYARSRIQWQPSVLLGKGPDGVATHVMALPTMGAPPIFAFDRTDLETFYPDPT